MTIVTDSLTINSVWHRAHSDFFLVANDLTAEVLAKAGVPSPENMHFRFSSSKDIRELHWNPHGSAPLVDAGVSCMWSTPVGIWRPRLHDVCSLEQVSLTVTVGRDHDLARQLTIRATLDRRKLNIRGWTSEMPQLMAENHLLIKRWLAAPTSRKLSPPALP